MQNFLLKIEIIFYTESFDIDISALIWYSTINEYEFSEKVRWLIVRLVEFAEDEGGEVRDALLAGERVEKHGGRGDPLVRAGEGARHPGVFG